jgi:cell division protein ZapB
MSEHQLPPRKGNTIFFIGIILLLAGIIIYQQILRSEDKEIITQSEMVISEKSAELDKVSGRLADIQKELDEKLKEIVKLKGDTSSLAGLRRQIERDLRWSRAKNQKSLALIGDLQDRIEEYERNLLAKDKEIEDLREKFNSASKDNRALKNSLVEKEEQIQSLAVKNDNMSQKLNIAKKLKAESIKIIVIDKKGKEKEEEDDYKAKWISKLKINYSIAENQLADIGNREVFMRILGPSGEFLGDPGSGGGTFSLEGNETPYTSKMSFLFDNKQNPPPFTWEKGSPFSTGTYTIELFCEGYKLGQANFKVR